VFHAPSAPAEFLPHGDRAATRIFRSDYREQDGANLEGEARQRGRFLIAVVLRRYVTYCARRRRAAMVAKSV